MEIVMTKPAPSPEGVLRSAWHATVWNADQIDPDRWENRNDVRVWFPLYSIIALFAGIWAAAWGSPILHLIYDDATLDAAGVGMAIAATLALIGVVFPLLRIMELVGHLTLFMLLGIYSTGVALFRADPDPATGFVVFIIMMALIPSAMRWHQVLEELIDRRRDRLALLERELR